MTSKASPTCKALCFFEQPASVQLPCRQSQLWSPPWLRHHDGHPRNSEFVAVTVIVPANAFKFTFNPQLSGLLMIALQQSSYGLFSYRVLLPFHVITIHGCGTNRKVSVPSTKTASACTPHSLHTPDQTPIKPVKQISVPWISKPLNTIHSKRYYQLLALWALVVTLSSDKWCSSSWLDLYSTLLYSASFFLNLDTCTALMCL